MKGLILAGGIGKRLKPITDHIPKQIIPIAGKPVIHYCIENLVKAGITDIGIVIGYSKERINAIKNSIGDGSKFGVKFTYIEQDAPRGTGHGIMIAKGFIKTDDFVVYYGDNLLKGDISKFVNDFKKENADAGLMLAKVNNPREFGIATLDDNKVIKVEEKPENPETNYAITGIYIFKPSIFDILENLKLSPRGELELTDAIKILIDRKKKIICNIADEWKDIGTKEDLIAANQMMLDLMK